MPIFSHRTRHLLLGFACCTGLLVGEASGANWSVTAGGSLVLDTSASGLTVGGMSGIAYVGPAPTVGKHRFLAVQDTGAGVVTFDAEFDLGGGLLSATAVSNQPLSVSLDFEGIARVGDAIFLSDEAGPGVREFEPDGNQLQSVTIPTVFANARGNRGFESLAYDESTSTLWTANEEALTVDGALATQTSGTTVRLLELDVNGNTVTAGGQFAYEVDPIHGSDGSASTRSGLAELVAMPDGTLLALERSLAASIPPYQSRFYEIDFAGTTDVSVAPLDTGLTGQSFTAVGKELLWSGSAGGGFGQNLEGLAVGPRLPNGDWLLLGVVDDGGSSDFLSSNTIVAFTASPTTPIPLAADSADFDDDGDVDGIDYLAWQRGMGVATLAGATHGDANQDGQVTGADLAIWQNQYATATSANSQAVPEPTSVAIVVAAIVFGITPRKKRTHSQH